MNKEYEIAHLISMIAHARVLAATSTNKKIMEASNLIKDLGVDMATSAGLTEEQFNMLTIEIYMKLIKDVPNNE